jgi:methionyl aminopeptidase
MINLKNKSEIEKLYSAGQIVKETLFLVEEHIKPGISTLELDKIAEDYIRSKNAIPGFKGLYGFPGTLCISIDDEVVHGIPSERILKKGQIISVDVGSIYQEFYGDHAKTFIVHDTCDDNKKLIDVTRECLMLGIEQMKVGNRIGDIGFAVQKHAESKGYGVVRDLVGHGIGRKLHEDPQVPNYGDKGTGPLIENGLCLAIEPMINLGTEKVYTKDDNWTLCTLDGKPSAHFEHSVAVIDNKIRILTA